MGLRRTSDFIIFFKKEKMWFSFWGPTYQKNKRKKKKKKKSEHVLTKMSIAICDSLFLGRKRVKRRNKRQNLQT